MSAGARAFALVCTVLSSACHGYARVRAPAQEAVPVRVSFPSPVDVHLRRDSPDSLLSAVTQMEGTLLELTSDSLRVEVVRARSHGRWANVPAPGGGAVANVPGTVVERRVVSPTKTALVILGSWVILAVVIHSALGWP